MTTDRSLLEVRQAAPWAVLRTGAARVEDVEVLDDDGRAIDAWVHGEGDHVVRMARVAYGDVCCTCGGGSSPWCAHAVAVALKVLRDRGVETGEALARFAGRAEAMARLVEAEEALADQYAAIVDDDGSAFADLVVDLGGRDLDGRITAALSGPTREDERRLLRFVEHVLGERVDGAEVDSADLVGLAGVTSMAARAHIPAPARARVALMLYPRARSRAGGAWTSPGWWVLESVARMLDVGVRCGNLELRDVARALLDAEAGRPAVIDRIPVLGRLAPVLGRVIGHELAIEFEERQPGSTGDVRRRLDIAVASWDPTRLSEALERWPDAPLGEISGVLRGRPVPQRVPVIEVALARAAVRGGGWPRPASWNAVPSGAMVHTIAQVHGILRARAESDREGAVWRRVPAREVREVLAGTGRLESVEGVYEQLAARARPPVHPGGRGGNA